MSRKSQPDLAVMEVHMYMRGVRTTFTNDMMKHSVLAFMEQHTPGDRMISFVVHISENQILRVVLYANKEEADQGLAVVKPFLDKIKQMGAKQEMFEGEVTNYSMAGGLTLDQLTKHIN